MNKASTIKSKYLLIIVLLFSSDSLFADVKLPALFANNMVLQQKSQVAIWGWASAEEKVSIHGNWNHKTVSVIADASGKWLAKLQTTKAGGPYTLTVSGNNKIQLENVLLGEVWLCSGQSNMDYRIEPLKGKSWQLGIDNYGDEVAKGNFPAIRMFTVVQKTSETPLTDVTGEWEAASSQTVGHFSAVAYFFAKRLQGRLHVPVGLIHSSWGGTPAEAWTSKESMQNDNDFKPMFDRFEQAKQKYITASKNYEDQLAQWKAKGDTSLKAPAKPAGVPYSQSPAQLYNGMIAPLVPYTIKGVIWYQGESNSGRAYQYTKLFPVLINQWRKDWNTQLPFYFVQIAPHYQQSPEIREAQLLTLRSLPKTGMAVIVDAGDSLNIHPKNKEVVGHRLALWALANDYGKNDLVYSGPLYKGFKTEGDKITIQFDFADGLTAKDRTLTDFTIAGADQKFAPANARIEGNTVVVWSEQIKDPAAVRLGWKNFPHVNLYNGAGLPASPFRTDNWKWETEGKN